MIWILQFGYEKKNIRSIGCPNMERDENMARKILV